MDSLSERFQSAKGTQPSTRAPLRHAICRAILKNMSTLIELEKDILALPAAERERLATAAWESLVRDPGAAGDRSIDPEGIDMAAQRDTEIESGRVKPIGHAEFVRRTGGT